MPTLFLNILNAFKDIAWHAKGVAEEISG